MRRGIAWAAGLAGLLTAFLLRRRSSATVPPADPAAELRRKLAAAREAAPDEAHEPPVDEPAAQPDADARRREVHAQARAAIDEMRRPDEG